MLLLHCLPMTRFLMVLLPQFAVCFLLFGMTAGAASPPAKAESPALMLRVDTGGEVLRCDARLSRKPQALLRALREGSEISVAWRLRVDIVRKYWLNKSLAEVEVRRRVIPDLVSRSWRLVDETSGISRRVFALDEAVNFLTRLRRFPVVDRSLLERGRVYRFRASLSEREGAADDHWWNVWFGEESSAAGLSFALP